MSIYIYIYIPKRSGHLNISGNISFTEKCFRQKLYSSKIFTDLFTDPISLTLGCVAIFFFYYRGKMLYAHPSALTRAGSDFRPSPKESELPTLPTRLGFRGSVGLDVPCHAAVDSPYPLKTLFPSDTLQGARGVPGRLYFPAPHHCEHYTQSYGTNHATVTTKSPTNHTLRPVAIIRSIHTTHTFTLIRSK